MVRSLPSGREPDMRVFLDLHSVLYCFPLQHVNLHQISFLRTAALINPQDLPIYNRTLENTGGAVACGMSTT